MRWVGCFGQTLSTWASIALGCRALHPLLYLFLEDPSSDFIINRREIGAELSPTSKYFFQKSALTVRLLRESCHVIVQYHVHALCHTYVYILCCAREPFVKYRKPNECVGNANRFEEIPPALEQGILEANFCLRKPVVSYTHCCVLHTVLFRSS